LPIYLLLDTSESMAGEALEQMCRGIDGMVQHLRNDPHALETAWLSVLTFSNTARQVVPLTELMDFTLPRLSVRTGTALGAGLRLLSQCLQREVARTTATTKGDYKPLVILFSDGQPTDSWESAAEQLKAQRHPAVANTYAIGCGADVDTDVLRRITDIVLCMKDLSPEAWRKVFVWLSASVQTQSMALGAGREGEAINLPALPDDALELAPRSSMPRDPRPRQVFLHARCVRDGRPYLMRFARRPHGDTYVALGAHVLDAPDDVADEAAPSSIRTEMLEGCPSCPYCENPIACQCACGTLFCFSGDARRPLVCPVCKEAGTAAEGRGGFDVRQARG
jgi:uncharacterized protein YegL